MGTQKSAEASCLKILRLLKIFIIFFQCRHVVSRRDDFKDKYEQTYTTMAEYMVSCCYSRVCKRFFSIVWIYFNLMDNFRAFSQTTVISNHVLLNCPVPAMQLPLKLMGILLNGFSCY